MPRLFIGCSGFTYPHWRGRFYPEKLGQAHWFEYYTSVFSSVELNVTFYRLVKPETFDRWRENSPTGFSFTVKGSRYITHIKKLEQLESPLERFFEGVLHLEEKLAAVLWQFPPSFALNMERLEKFLNSLEPYGVRHAFEFRNESWGQKEVFDLLAKAGAALCSADWPEFAADPPLTADFVYLRRHGRGGEYSSRYSTEELEADARRIRRYLEKGEDVHIYFNNDVNGYAPENARELMGMLGMTA